jgi:hypothetical protein
MANGKLVWLNFENIDALTTLTKSFDVKSPNNVVSILVDLAQKTKDIQLEQMRLCPTCNKEFEIEENTSRAYKLKDHIRHCDLEDTICKQICKIQHRVKLKSNDIATGATTTNDDTIDKELVILRRGLKDDEVYRTIDDDQGRTVFLTKEENEIYNKTGKLPDLSNENNE